MKPGTGPPGPQNPQSQTRSTGLSSGGANLQQHYQPTNLATAAALAAVSSFSTTPDDFSRSAGINALTSRLSQTNLSQHQGSSLPLQRKVTQQVQGTGLSDGMRNLVSGSVSTPMDHTPVALSFSSEPLEIEMNKEAEAEANTFFQKLLGGSSSPEDMFKTVCEYATQGNLAQRRLLDGILRMLADEVSQFLQDYPEPMLPQIANLYGSILAASTHLLSIRALSMLWRAVIARLHQFPPDTSMEIPLFRAMVLILIKAKNTFTQFFNLPNCLVMCPVFKQFPHELQEYLLNAEMIAKNYVLSHQSTSSGTKSGQFQGSHQALSCSTPGSSTQLSTMAFTAPPPLPSQSDLLVKPPDPPEEAVSDRIYFLFNNVSKTNVKEKSTELADLLLTDERIQPWFAFYLVGKRVPVEHTFHDLFALVLDHVQEKVPNVRPRIMQELIRNIKLLLRNIRLDRDDMQARSTLKNLGSFLGLITLARNKPLLHDDLNVKDLIYEAYHKGPIPTQYVVPFVARVVRGATESIVFQPPNPWTMAILKVFRELYDMRDVKDCLRFEIEILYRAFKLNLEDVQLAYFLRDPNHLANLEVHLCFLVTASTVTASISLDTATVSMAGVATGAEQSGATTATSLSNATDLVPVSSNMTSQQQMLTMLAALQKQQIAGSQNTNLDVANLMQSSLASSVGNTGGRSQASHTLALAAAMASGQQQKQPPQTQQQQPQQQPFVSGSTGAGSATAGSQSLAFAQQQKQMAAAAVAALQTQWHSQQQQQPSMLSGASAPSQYSNIGGPSNQHNIPDSTNDVPLRYEEVSIRTIRNCLNLDELIAAAAAAAASNRSGGPTNNAATAAVALLQANPRLRGLIEPAITRAINELTTPVFERCARITVTTVAAIVRKDFALDPNPNRMLFAARQMVRHLAAGMSLTTAREALGVSLVTTLKNIILVEVQSASGQEKEAVQRLAHFLVAEAMHACLAFMQKSVAEKAVSDIEQKLEPDLKLRAEMSPRRFLEQASSQLAAQQAKVPEPLKLKVGGPTPAEMAVYEEFGRVIPGFAPSTSPNSTAAPSSLNHASMMQPSSPNAAVAMAAYLQQQQQQQQQQDFSRIQRQVSAPNTGSAVMMLKPLMSQSQVTAQSHQLLLQQQQQQQAQISQAPITGLFDKIIGQIERHVAAISARLRSTTDPMIRSLRCLIDAVHLAKTSRDANVAMNVIATMVQSFLEHYRPGCWRNQPHGLETMEHLKEAHMLTLRHMLSSDQAPFGCAWVTSQVTQTWIRLDGGSLSGDRSSRTPSGNATTDPNAKDGVHVGKSETEENTTNEANRDQAASIWSGGWKSQTDGAASVEATSSEQNRLGSIKWNWEAFAELLKVHVVYLSQVDAYLAKEVSAGHPGAISFVIDLLDHFVLPCPSGTAVGAAAAAAAAAAANYVRSAPPVIVNGTQTNAPTGPNSSSTTTSGSLSTISPSTKREFTVLNEYDLWSTLEAMRTRVSTLNAAMSANSVAGNRINTTSLTDPLALRLRLACARVRGLLDLGLLEQSPLFATPPGCAQPPISALYAGCSQAREFDDPPTLQEKVELLMRNWVEIYQSPRQRDANTIDALLAQLVQIGVLANMDNLTRFLRLATIFVVERALKQLKLQDQQQQHALQMPPVGSGLSVTRVAAYIELDAYTRLISIVIKRGGVQAEQPNFKVVLLNKVLGIIAGMLLQEHEVRRDWFYTMPFERILIMLFVELHPPVTVSEMEALHSTGCVSMSIDGVVGTTASTETGGNSAGDVSKTVAPADKTLNTDTRGLLGRNLTLQQQLPLIFCHLLHCLRPERASAFVFAWLEMLAHRWFVDRILSAPGPPELRAAYQAMYAQLLVDLLKFLAYFLQNAVMVKPIQCLYKATLRLFLVLIHDFPEFVSDYYALFCDVVPSNSIQLRNLILSALPKRGMPSADPVQAPPVDHLASLEDPTGYCMEAGSRLPEPMRRELDAYLASRAPVKLLSELVTMLRRADDVLPPFPPPQFAHHPQQQARHQQALVAYAVALAANDTPAPAGSVLSNTKSSEKPTGDDSSVAASGSQPKKFNAGKHATESSAESGELAATNTISTEDSMSSASRSAPSPSLSTSSAAAAALQWGVRATQQLATFGLADGMHYNVELMNNLTLYVCITAIRSLREKGMPLNMSTIAHTPQMDIIQSLVLNLDNEGRYLLLNCMANQLRYPNSHTYYFSYTILYLFSEQSKEQVKEQISRVLLERLIVNRPHPWGLLMTGAELLRNPAYRFWEHEFARCHPEIEHIVTVVARSCIPNFQLPAINPSGGSSIASSNVVPGLRSALSSSVPHGRRQASPLTRGTANVGGAVHPSNLPTPLLTE
ncbi:CCR4-NOT transcription complex subunit 1 [Fasciola hepatica]|uniref:CCR4-NOT transcription complex subunit 1 n=1 Tax=Fasciola hepatica TaxID=6192 RepID=A0A4E0RC28_FASHE|nr:CCR4-NOT transcription complex subunit 1 [Fasciola hepatica]